MTPILEETVCDRSSCITGPEIQLFITPDGMLTVTDTTGKSQCEGRTERHPKRMFLVRY